MRHFCIATKKYRDKQCAEFMLTKALMRRNIHNKGKIYWRVTPMIDVHDKSWFQGYGYMVYRGLARFTVANGYGDLLPENSGFDTFGAVFTSKMRIY